MLEITFLGGAGTVTGSKFLVTSGSTRLLVDCGLFQGVKTLRLRNRRGLPFEPADLDGVVLSHAHLDHSGYLPALVRDGYPGPIHATPPTIDLCGILLPDSGHIQEEDARYANRKRFTRHSPALPLYTEDDARAVQPRFRATGFGETFQVGDLEVTLRPAGHILGAASVLVSDGSRRVLFSGDLGRPDDLLMRAPAAPPAVDCLVMESTYGDRRHPERDPIEAVAEVLDETLAKGGVLLVPSFAVGRAQTLLYIVHEIFRRELVRRVPVYLNSPMATSVTELYERHVAYHRLSADRCADVCDVAEYVRTVEESKALTGRWFPSVIVAASGMATGGRVLHHLKTLAPDHHNTILLPGFQAPGTRGWKIANGAESVKIHGARVPIRARVETLDMLSAHADQEDLLAWAGSAESPPGRVLLVHGEPAAADELRLEIQDRLQLRADVSEDGETVRVE